MVQSNASFRYDDLILWYTYPVPIYRYYVIMDLYYIYIDIYSTYMGIWLYEYYGIPVLQYSGTNWYDGIPPHTGTDP